MPKTRILIKKRQQAVQYYTEQLVDGVGLDMVLIPAGQFWMGSPEGELERNDEGERQHLVTIPEFFMARYPITQGQWKAVVEQTKPIAKDLDLEPSDFKEDFAETGDRWLRPVESVAWDDAIEFCARLSKLTNRQYRLPSEAEWEYACRGISVTSEELSETGGELTQELWNQKFCQPFHFGETISTDLANYAGNYTYGRGVKGEYRKQTTPVAYFKVANEFGLYDMHGNVDEWCADPWHEHYEDNAPTDGSVWDEESKHQYYNIIENAESLLKSQQNRVVRGGPWFAAPRDCRSAYRSRWYADNRNYYVGFRVCRSRPDS